MKKIFLLCLLPILLHSQSQYRFFVNDINMPMDNRGVLAQVNIPPDGSTGRYEGTTFLFDGGFWLSGYNADTLWANGMATAAQFNNYNTGNVDSNSNDTRYKIYVVENSNNIDYLSWDQYKIAVDNGAEYYDGDGNGIYDPIDLNGNNIWDPNEDKPDLLGLGSQTAWCVYNDGVPASQRTKFPTVNPLGIEIHQSVFAFNTYSATQLRDVLFIKYKIINTGKINSKLDSVYFSSWSDADLGEEFMDDLVASDTLLNSGFVYNSSDSDPGFGTQIPAFFITLLQGPQTYIPGETFLDNNSNGIFDEGTDTPIDTAYNKKGPELGIELYPGAKNSSMTSFIHFNQLPLLRTPNNPLEARYYMNGLTPDGFMATPCDSPFTFLGEVTGGVNCNDVNPLYFYSGDPVTSVGWLNTFYTDQRMSVNTGPFSLEAGKPVSILVAYIVGRGTDRLNSILKAREKAAFTHQFYQSNFNDNLVSVENEISNIPSEFLLYQNYPNPFNPTTTIKYSIPSVISNGERNLNVTLKVYDILGSEIVTLVNEELSPGSYKVEFKSTVGSLQLPSGVYFYKLQAGSFVETKKMILIK